jgi:uncharacterized protein YciI
MNKSTVLAMSLLAFLFLSCATLASEDTKAPNISYNEKLAKELGADEYGMRSYVLVILKTGPNDEKIVDKDKRAELFKGHFSNMARLSEEGKLVLAGPLMEDKPKRGLFIFNVKTIDEAKQLVETDPTIEAGIFVFEMTKYYGSAALLQVADIHKTIQKTSI